MSIPIGSPLTTPGPGKGGLEHQSGQPGSASWAAWLMIGLAIAAVVALGVSLTLSPARDAAQQAAPAVQPTGEVVNAEIRIEAMAYIPNSIEVPAGARLVLTVSNDDHQPHDLFLNGVRTELINPGESTTLDAGVFNTDTQGYCTIAGHRSQGMLFDVLVIQPNAPSGAAHSGEHSAHASGSVPTGVGAATWDNPFLSVPSAAERSGANMPAQSYVNPVLAPAPEARVHEVELVVSEKIREVAPGHKQMQFLFNGQSPGPTLRGQVGDTFKITLKNNGTMGHSVDFHAGEISPDAAMATIAPGEELLYEFVAQRSGIWMYHCATAPMSLHIANGMAGVVIIDPPGQLDEVDQEFLLVANEVFLGPTDSGADAERVAAGFYDLTAFNGYPNQYDIKPLELKTGQRARFWVLNVGPDNPVSFHIVGTIFDTVFTEGQYTIRQGSKESTGAQVLPLLAAQGGFVEASFLEPGTYTFVNHQMSDAEKGQHGQILVR